MLIFTSDNGGVGGLRREGIEGNTTTDNSPLRAGKILAQETPVVRNMFENVNEQKDVRADELRWWGVLDKSQGTVVFDALARIVRVDTESALT